MDLYCTKHKKSLSERYDAANSKIESYCVDCEMEKKFSMQMEQSSDARKETIKKLSFKVWLTIIMGFLILYFLPVHIILKVLLAILLAVLTLKMVFEPFLSQASPTRRPDWDDIRAKALNQSSIQANEVDNVKRQWKKGFLQERRNQKWTEEDWQQYLVQFYKKE